jgi:hypothetical protein
MPRYYVVRVNRNDADTHAADTLAAALELANADEHDDIEFGIVSAADAGAARLVQPHHWVDANFPAYAWPGGYPIVYVCHDGGEICPTCANAECRDKSADDSQWAVVSAFIHYEGDPIICEHCNAEIESAYGPVEGAE